MAGDLNRVTIIGRLTRDPELKYIQSGAAVTNFSIATNRVYTSNGEKKEEVSYFECIAWGKLGEIITEYMTKGRRVGIEGRLQQRRWEDQEGNKKSKIEIIVDNIQFLDVNKETGEKNHTEEDSIPEPEIPGYKPSAPDKNLFSDDNIPF